MTNKQYGRLVIWFRWACSELHHGDCIGADYEAHALARSLVGEGIHIVIHPPRVEKNRAFCEGDEIRKPKTYLERNRDIVDASDILLAAPKGSEHEYFRSGTWHTVRYALTVRVPTLVIYPDGSLDFHFFRGTQRYIVKAST